MGRREPPSAGHIACEQCHGNGQGWTDHGDGETFFWDVCDECGGGGEVPDDFYTREDDQAAPQASRDQGVG